ncbi:olfactory receptor 1571-like [Salarias fasciatus]|uniref:olfactory receptor 1571-like n=1 Tax=Salarias fasciatus TaxID=181472 RepID=UPI0011768C63|nr:olfactory receptor 1571-like [Salarias fasciatus]
MGTEVKTTLILNSTFVRPAAFYISGFTDIPHINYFYVFLCFVYIATVLGNGFLMAVICLMKTLHTPKYIIVFNLALTDLCGSTALIPKLLDTFLFGNRYIVYEACLSYLFFVLLFLGMQSYILLTMAFDRFVAICFPLRYHAVVTKSSIGAMLLFAWLYVALQCGTGVQLIDRLSFCESLVVKSFFCDHGPIIYLACNDTSSNKTMAYIALISVTCIPFVLIGVTYVCISVALIRIASGQERFRALKTCTSHLILVAIYYLPLLVTNMAALTSYIHPNARIINSTLTHTIPPLLDPLIYALKTEEVLTAIKTLFKRNRRPHAITK